MNRLLGRLRAFWGTLTRSKDIVKHEATAFWGGEKDTQNRAFWGARERSDPQEAMQINTLTERGRRDERGESF